MITNEPWAGHPGAVRAVAVNADGTLAASGGDDGAVRVWDLIGHEELHNVAAHLDHVTSIAIAGEIVVSVGASGSVRAWLPSGDHLREIDLPVDHGSAVTAKGDHRVVVAGRDGVVRAVGTTSRDSVLVAHLATPATDVSAARYGEAVATLDGDTITVSAESAGMLRQIDHPGPAVGVAMTGNGSTVVSAGRDGVVRLWDARDGTLTRSFPLAVAPLTALALATDRDVIVLGADDGVVWTLNPTTAELARVIQHKGAVTDVAVSANGMTIVSGGADRLVRFVNPGGGSRAGGALAGHGGGVRTMALGADRRTVITGGEDRAVREWRLDTGELVVEYFGPTSGIRAVGVDGPTVLAYAEGGQVSRNGGTVTWQMAYAAAFSPSAEYLVCGSVYGSVTITPLTESRPAANQRRHEDWVRAVSISPDGRLLATGGDDRTIRVGPLDEDPRHSVRTPAQVYALSVDHDRVLAGGPSGDVLLSSLGSAEDQVHTFFVGHTTDVHAVLLADDQVFAGADDGTIRVWNRDQPGDSVVLHGHVDRVRSLLLDPDGRLLSGGDDGTVRVWDLTTFRQVAGTRFTTPPPLRERAGITCDTESAQDRLGFAGDVDTLAALIADRGTEPPLAIALLGPWGSGKSSFMRQLSDRVRALADRSRNNPARAVFASSVRQVRFNAWQYSDDHLWVGLVEHLFDSLTDPEAGPPTTTTEREAAHTTLRETEARQKKLARELAMPVRGSGMLRLPAHLRLLWTERRMLRGWRGWLSALGITGVGLAGWLLWDSLLPLAGAVAGTVALVLAYVVDLRGRFTPVQELARQQLVERKHEVDQQVIAARAELARVDPVHRLAVLIEQVRAGHYEPYRGLLGQVHRDLRGLDTNVSRALADWRQAGASGPVPLERVILYVDDLDRCPPRKVVEVLSAVHLLLALPLFVVVVAVDPAWLRRALEQHHEEMFGVDSSARPLDFLDKIFQIPFALRPMGDGAHALIDSLLPVGNQRTAPSIDTPVRTQSPVRDAPVPQRVGRPAAAPDQAGPDKAGPGRHPTLPRPDLDPQPDWLRPHADEQAFVKRLSPLLGTPRAVKKLVNLYRLVRIGVPHERLDGFLAGDYQAVLVLLAITVARPELARPLHAELRASAPGADLLDLLNRLATDEPDVWSPFAALLNSIGGLHTDLDTYRSWSGTLARFSFETYDMVDSDGSTTGQ